jgi:hypothetical protein
MNTAMNDTTPLGVLQLDWLVGRSLRILLIVPPLMKINQYSPPTDPSIWSLFKVPLSAMTLVGDVFRGFTESTIGSFSNSSETQTCWMRGLEISSKSITVMPQAVTNRDWPKFISTGHTVLQLIDPFF